jgi:hypothetical protein
MASPLLAGDLEQMLPQPVQVVLVVELAGIKHLVL